MPRFRVLPWFRPAHGLSAKKGPSMSDNGRRQVSAGDVLDAWMEASLDAVRLLDSVILNRNDRNQPLEGMDEVPNNRDAVRLSKQIEAAKFVVDRGANFAALLNGIKLSDPGDNN